jgi:hypothetical protein
MQVPLWLPADAPGIHPGALAFAAMNDAGAARIRGRAWMNFLLQRAYRMWTTLSIVILVNHRFVTSANE